MIEPLPLVNSKALVDDLDFWTRAYDGCSVARHCLQCPLPTCRLDEPGPGPDERQRQARSKRDANIWRWRLSGITPTEISRAMKISTRTVHRVIQRGPPSEGVI